MNEYDEEDFLDISGIQHFAFCRRQWALIHIEKEWEDNDLTILGDVVHEQAHDASFTEKRGNILILRNLEIKSRRLGTHGFCDVVEFHKNKNGVPLFGRDGSWLPMPVEYKKGRPKTSDADRLQLCTQAICLEEMFDCEIKKAYLFYHDISRREEILLDDQLREKVYKCFDEMHGYYDRSYTPRVKESSRCNRCSLRNVCLPELNNKEPVSSYIERKLAEDIHHAKIK